MLTLLFRSLYYFIGFTIAGFFLLLGIFGIVLPWSASIRTDLVFLILENSIAISLFGLSFLVIGLAMLVHLSLTARKQYYYFSVDSSSVAVEESIIKHYLDTYFEHLFPNQQVSSHIVVRKNKIKVMADLPYALPEERSSLLERMQTELREILVNLLGYSQEFILSVNFSTKP